MGATKLFIFCVNRYECPPGCLEKPGKVVGTAYYDMVNTHTGS